MIYNPLPSPFYLAKNNCVFSSSQGFSSNKQKFSLRTLNYCNVPYFLSLDKKKVAPIIIGTGVERSRQTRSLSRIFSGFCLAYATHFSFEKYFVGTFCYQGSNVESQ